MIDKFLANTFPFLLQSFRFVGATSRLLRFHDFVNKAVVDSPICDGISTRISFVNSKYFPKTFLDSSSIAVW